MEPKVTAAVPLKYDSNTQVSFRNPSVATLQGNAGGLTIIGGSGSGDDITLQSTTHGTKGTLFFDDIVNLWPSVPDDAGLNTSVMSFDATLSDSIGNTFLRGFKFSPTFTVTGTSAATQFNAVLGAGTYNYGANQPFSNLFQLFVAQPAINLTAASVTTSNWTILSQQSISASNAITAASTSNMVAFDENSILGSASTTGTAGWTAYTGFRFNPRMASGTGATTTITTSRALHVQNLTKSGTGTNTLTTQIGVDIEDLTSGATNIGIRSTIAAVTNKWFIYDSGGANSAIKGKVRIGDNTAPTLQLEVGAGAITGNMDTMTYASPISLDVTKGNVHKTTTVNATGSVTINASAGGTAGQFIWIIIVNDATSAKTITFGTNFKSSGTLTASAASRSTCIGFVSDGTSWYETGRSINTS